MYGMQQIPYVQRMRLNFRKAGLTRWISHLDLSRTWERALNRAKIPMAYTQGFNRRPRMQFAHALALGYTSDDEYIDLWLVEWLEPAEAVERLVKNMAPGIEVLSAMTVPPKQPALPTLTSESIFVTKLTHESADPSELQAAIDTFMTADEVMAEKHSKKNRGKLYNLRPRVHELSLEISEPLTIHMRLTAIEGKAGRPDHVIKALGLDHLSCHIHRTQLLLKPEAIAGVEAI